MSIDPILSCGRSGPRYQKTSQTSSGGASTSTEYECSCMGGEYRRGVPGEPGEMHVADSVLDLVGNTPLVRLAAIGARPRLRPGRQGRDHEPGRIVKDRPAVAMIDAAEREGC